MNLNSVEKRIADARRVVDRQIAEARLIATNSSKLKEEINLASTDVETYNKVAITLASIGETRQADAQSTIESLVTHGLRTIFGDDLSFKVVQTQRGKTPEVKFYIESSMANGRTVQTAVMDARGGGLAAVVGFLLKIVIMLLDKDKTDPILIMDESFSHVSAEFRRPLAEFIVELINKTRSQIVLVTHDDVFLEFADKRYKLKLVNGITKSEEI